MHASRRPKRDVSGCSAVTRRGRGGVPSGRNGIGRVSLLPDNCAKWNVEANKRHRHDRSGGSSARTEVAPQTVVCPASSGSAARLVVAPGQWVSLDL